MYRQTVKLSLVACLILTSACGSSGGGGDDFVGAGRASITASPSSIDTADRTLVVIKLSQIAETGIGLKIRFATALEYVPDSASITANNQSSALNPLFNESPDGEDQYMAFFLSAAQFGPKAEGEIRLELVGREELDSGKIEIDADVDDPAVPNLDEFDPANPNFTSEADASIDIKA